MTARRAGPVAVLKALLDLASLLVVAPLAGLYYLQAWVVPSRADMAIQGYSQLVSLIPGLPGVFLRRAFYRLVLQRCPRACSIGFGTLLVTPRISIGDGTYIGTGCNISHATIGDDVLIGSGVTVLSGKYLHDFSRTDIPIRHQGGRVIPISIGRDVWIGNGAIVMADVAAHAVVAAGSVVVKPVAAWTIVGGNPARVVGSRGEFVADATTTSYEEPAHVGG